MIGNIREFDIGHGYKKCLGVVYAYTRSNTKRKYPGIPDHEVTSKTMQRFLREKRISKQKRRKDIEELVSSYQELKLSL